MKKKSKTQLAIKAAVERAGGASVVAEELGLKGRAAVNHWIKVGRVPANRLVYLAELAGMTTDMVLGVGERDEK